MAWDRLARRWRFVKVYKDPEAARRETAVLRALPRHPCLVRPRGFFLHDGYGHILMDLARGRSLRQIINERGPLPVPLVRAIARNLLLGLVAVHRAGYVHGDLHSGNVLLTDLRRGRIKIVDFQHAARKDRSGKAQAVRRLDRIRTWLAPETSTGLLDDRTDLYGVGYMCAAMLLGRNPAAEEITARARSQTSPAPAPDGPSSATGRGRGRPLRPNVWEVLATATQPSPAQRFRSAREMLVALNRASWTEP